MSKWPQTIPDNLKQMLDDRDGFRDRPSQQDRWGVIRDWLIQHGVEAPEVLPMTAPPEEFKDN